MQIDLKRHRINKFWLLIFCIVVFAVSIAPGLAQAPRLEFTVNDFRDIDDVTPGDGICDAVSGELGDQCTLRAAITETNDTEIADIINVPAGTYTLTLTGGIEDINVSGDLDIIRSLTIIGAGRDQTIIKGDTGDNIVHILSPTFSRTISISNLTISGDVNKGATNLLISAPTSIITLTNVALLSNQRGLANLGGVVGLSNCVISNNDNAGGTVPAQLWGSGIHNRGIMSINDTEISNNKARGASTTGGSFYGFGGGIFNESVDAVRPGNLTISESTISGNEAQRSGGGIYNKGTGIVSIINTDIDTNIAGTAVITNMHGSGGGIYNETDDNLTLTNVTISNNQADAGGGIFNTGGGTIDINDSNISSNIATNPPDGDGTPDDFNPIYGGGGIANGGSGSTIDIYRTNVSGNESAAGGGLLNYNAALMTVNNSAIYSNTATTTIIRAARGAGVYNGRSPNAATMTITNVTISSNNAFSVGFAAEGGGVWNRGNLTMTNLTIADNVAGVIPTLPGTGGGFYQDGNGTQNSVHIYNTILDDNASTQVGADCRDELGAVVSHGNNLLGDSDGCPTFGDDPNDGDLLDADALLGTLANYGGLTLTHELLLGSVAVNAGNNTTCPTLDQREFARVDGLCDIGAFERDGDIPTPTFTGTLTETFTPTNTSTFTPTYTPGGPTITPTNTLTPSNTPTVPTATNTLADPELTATAGGETLTPITTPVTPSVTPSETPTLTPTEPDTRVELVLNGGFEVNEDDDNKVPDEWKGKNLTSDKHVCNKDKNGDGVPDKIVAHTGECGFQFKGVAGENSKLQQSLAADVVDGFEQGDIFDLSIWAQRKKLKDGASVQLKFIYVNGNLGDNADGKDKIKLQIAKGDSEYEQLTAPSFVLKGTVEKVKLAIGYKGSSGKMYIDDVSLLYTGDGLEPPTATPTATSDVGEGTPTATPDTGGTTEQFLNNSFETNEDNDNKVPDEWDGKNLTSDKHVCNGDKTVAHTGECAFQFKGAPGENSSLGQTISGDTISLYQAGDLFDFSLWVERKKLKSGAKAQVTFKYVNGNLGDEGKDKVKIEIASGDGDYEQLTAPTFTLPGIVKSVKVKISYTGNDGQMNIDDVSLLRTSGGALTNNRLVPLPPSQ